MFTWICPQCGREVPPAYNDCPDCKERAEQAGGPVPPAPPQGYPPPPPPQQPPPPPQYYQQPPQAPPPPPPPPQYQEPQAPRELTGALWNPPQSRHPQAPPPPPPPPQYYQQPPQPPPGAYYGAPPPPAPSRGMNLPIWLMTILFALACGGVVLGIVWLMSSNKGAGTGPSPTAAVESPAAKPGAKTNPMQKYIEVTGVRFIQDAKKKTQVKFVVINHSEADVSGLAGNVTVWGRTKKSEEDAQGSFSFSTNLGPFESKELTVPLNTKLKIYELGDWQNITTDVQITAPGA